MLRTNIVRNSTSPDHLLSTQNTQLECPAPNGSENVHWNGTVAAWVQQLRLGTMIALVLLALWTPPPLIPAPPRACGHTIVADGNSLPRTNQRAGGRSSPPYGEFLEMLGRLRKSPAGVVCGCPARIAAGGTATGSIRTASG
jgi:hypothetical protein